jgi:hypothetical protein
MIGRSSKATGAPVATIKKAWEPKDSGHDVVHAIRRQPKSRLWKRWLEQLPGASLKPRSGIAVPNPLPRPSLQISPNAPYGSLNGKDS